VGVAIAVDADTINYFSDDIAGGYLWTGTCGISGNDFNAIDDTSSTAFAVSFSGDNGVSLNPVLKINYQGNRTIINKYYLHLGSDEDVKYAPKYWHIEASNDDTIWTTLDTRANQNFIIGKFNYNFANGDQYQYYRMSLLSGEETVYHKARISHLDFVTQQ